MCTVQQLFYLLLVTLIASSQKVIKTQLRGVNRCGPEYSCVKNLGIVEGPVNDESIKSIKSWKANVVRIPLNENCWLEVGNQYPLYFGKNYINAVTSYVKALRGNGISVILDLHWSHGQYSGPGTECNSELALCQKPMPNAKYSIAFWKSVATQFKGDDGIIFELFNEPYPHMVHSGEDAWKCLRDGNSACAKIPYQVAGMQDLVNAVRSTGATNPIMIGGPDYSGNLDQWLKYVPKDPHNRIVASWHSYSMSSCNNVSCWEKVIAPIALKYSVIASEIGETDCTHKYIDQLMPWMDKKGISYVAFTWNTWDCRSGPALITNYNGTPTAYGQGFRDHLTKS